MATRKSFELSIEQNFDQMVRALRTLDPNLHKRFRKTLISESKPMIAKVKASALAIPVKGEDSSGLRRRIARGVHLYVPRTGTWVRVRTRMRDPSEAMLPRGLEFPQGWRHPVFANVEMETRSEWTWVHQPGVGWFREPILEHRDELRDAFVNQLEEAWNDVDRMVTPL